MYDYDQYADEKARVELARHVSFAHDPAQVGLDLSEHIPEEERAAARAEGEKIDRTPSNPCPRCGNELVWASSSPHCTRCGYHEGCCG